MWSLDSIRTFRWLLLVSVLLWSFLALANTFGIFLSVAPIPIVKPKPTPPPLTNKSTRPSSGISAKKTLKSINFKQVLKHLNYFRKLQNLTSNVLTKLLEEKWDVMDQQFFTTAIQNLDNLTRTVKEASAWIAGPQSPSVQIKLGITVCGSRLNQAMVMLKSAVLFSLDASLHVIAVSDNSTITKLGQKILEMKMLLAKMGFIGFTYELVQEWYPTGKQEPDWKNMFRKCTNQRLFFPSVLKHHDAIIYMDTDVLVLSNLTDMWHLFQTKLMDKKLLGITPNSETHGHYYNPNTSVPYYGANGINAGVMLMNLKELRKFNFEARAKAIFTAYDKSIELADQDIINAVFHAFPGLVADIKCPYNFFFSHCDHETSTCYYKNTKKPEGIENICFCNPVMQEGVHILHGKSYSFTYTKSKYPFLFDTYSMFEKLDMYSDSYSGMFRALTEKFNSRDPKPCPPLTAEMLYLRGTTYLEKLGL